MCLFLLDQNQNKPEIATKDIKVYKVLEETSKGRFTSPFRGKRYIFGVRYFNAIGGISYSGFPWMKSRKIESGLHSFVNPIDAKYLIIGNPRNSIFIAKVPKGSEYYKGNEGDIVSNKLVVSNLEYDPNPSIFRIIWEWYKFRKL